MLFKQIYGSKYFIMTFLCRKCPQMGLHLLNIPFWEKARKKCPGNIIISMNGNLGKASGRFEPSLIALSVDFLALDSVSIRHAQWIVFQ